MRRDDYMQDSLSRGLSGASGQAAPATNHTGKAKSGKGEKTGASDRVSSNGLKGGRPEGDSRGRSASPGKGKGKEQR